LMRSASFLPLTSDGADAVSVGDDHVWKDGGLPRITYVKASSRQLGGAPSIRLVVSELLTTHPVALRGRLSPEKCRLPES
jgi:hypothetical protein